MKENDCSCPEINTNIELECQPNINDLKESKINISEYKDIIHEGLPITRAQRRRNNRIKK